MKVPQPVLRPIIRYLYDCLAAQTEWTRSLNVLEQKDVSLLPITKEQQFRLARDGSLTLSTPEAVEMANRFSTGGAETSLQLGALFLVGRRPAHGDTPERTFCAPLIDVPLKLRRDLSGNRVVLEPDDDEFSINYALVGELLGAEEDDLEGRLADLAELVPDFSIERGEFADFLNGFRMIATGLVLEDKLPRRRRNQPRMTPEAPDFLDRLSIEDDEDGEGEPVEEREALEFGDFYLPTIPKDEAFRILPAAAIVLGQQTHHALSTLAELKQMLEFPLEETALARVFDPPSAKPVETAHHKQVLLEDTFPLPLTQTQEAVVRNARSAPLTVVTGPPGTGKSYTITAIVLDALLRGERVLVASQMDKAVEVVADKVEEIVGTFAMTRSGGRAAQRALADKINRLTGPRRSRFKLQNLSIWELSGITQEHKKLSQRLETLEARYRETIKQERIWAESRESYDRLAPICPLPVHEISGKHVRRAGGSRAGAEIARG